MPYNAYFVNKTYIYLECGFDNFRKAKKGLEKIANCLSSKELACGEIRFLNEYVNKTTCYDINYKDGKANLHYTKCKKIFNKV